MEQIWLVTQTFISVSFSFKASNNIFIYSLGQVKLFLSSLLLFLFRFFLFTFNNFCCYALGSLIFCSAVSNLFLILSVVLDIAVLTRGVWIYSSCYSCLNFTFMFFIFFIKWNIVIIALLISLFINSFLSLIALFLLIYLSPHYVFTCSFEFLLDARG